MTTTTLPDPDDAGLRPWLDQTLATLTASLDAVVDVEAGLRDAQLPDRLRSLDARVGAMVDADAGLGTILPPQPQSHHEPPTATDPPARGPVREIAQQLQSLPPAERLRLRGYLSLPDLRLIREIDMMHRDSRVLIAEINGLVGACDDSALAHAQLRAHSLAHALANASAGGLVHSQRRARALALALALARGIDDAGDRALALDQARDLARDLHLARSYERMAGRARDVVLHRVLAEVADADAHLAALALAFNRVLGPAPDSDRAVEDLIDGIAAVEAAVTDFTDADLTDLDPTGMDLRGVRWSIRTTRWPQAWQQIIRDSSVPVDRRRHPKLYEVRDDPRARRTVT